MRLSNRVKGLQRTLIRTLFESMPADAVNLGLGQVDLPVPAALCGALGEAAADGGGRYGQTAGDEALRRSIASSYPGFLASESSVVITAGCQQATFAVLGALVDPGDEVLVPRPGFPGAERAASAWGAKPRAYGLHGSDGFHADVEGIVAAIGPKTRAVVLITPSNPLGSVEPAASIAALAAACYGKGVALILDDTYREFCWVAEGGAPGPPPEPLPNVVVCGGLSKSPGLAGWRVGWAACPDEAFVTRLIALQQTLLTCASTPIQVAARASFSTAGHRARQALVDRFRARREIVRERFPEGEFDIGPLEGAFYAWVRVPDDALAFARRLLDRDRIMVIPGVAFDEGTSDRIRVSYACEERALMAALDVLARYLRG